MDLRREIDPALLAALIGDMIYPIALTYLDWPGQAIRLHTNVGELEWNGQTWRGWGELGKLIIPDEGSGLIPEEAELHTLGPIAEVLSDLDEAQDAVGRSVQIWVGSTTEPGNLVLDGEPIEAFSGVIADNDAEISEDGSVAKIIERIRSGPSARARAEVTHSDEDQQARFAGDTLFRRVAHAEKLRANPPQW